MSDRIDSLERSLPAVQAQDAHSAHREALADINATFDAAFLAGLKTVCRHAPQGEVACICEGIFETIGYPPAPCPEQDAWLDPSVIETRRFYDNACAVYRAAQGRAA